MFSLRARHHSMATSVALALAASLSPAFGGIIATYDFTAGDSAAPTVSNATFSAFSRVNVGSLTPSGNFKANSWSNSGSIDTSEYVTFTLTPAGGYQVDLTALTFTTQRDSKGPTSEQVRNSVTNGSSFATAAGAFGYNLAGTNAVTSTWTLLGVTAQTGPVSFRFYGWNANSSGQGTLALDNVSLEGAISAIANNNTVITADSTANGGTTTVDLGRIMIGQTPATSVTINKSGSHTTTYAATPANNGLTAAAATGQFVGNTTDTLALQLVNNANGTASAGARSWNVTIANTAPTGTGAAGSGTGKNDANDTIAVQARVLADRTISATAAHLGRVLVNAPSLVRSITFSSSQIDNAATRLTFGASDRTQISGGATLTLGGLGGEFAYPVPTGAPASVTRGLGGVFGTSGTQSGTFTFTPLGEGLAGESVQSVSIPWDATVVANRTLTVAPVSLGKFFRGENSAAQSAAFASIAGQDDDHFTRISLAAGVFASGGVTLNNGAAARVFNSASGAVQSYSSSVAANFATSGDKNVTLDLLALGAAAGENLAGETPQPIQLNVQATVYERAALSSPASLQIANAPAQDPGGYRAAARISQVTVAGDEGFTLQNLATGATIAGGATLTGAANFVLAGRLNGLYTALATLTLEHDDQSIAGATAGDLGTFSFPLSQLVSGNQGAGQSDFAPGHSLAGFGLTSDKTKSTVATFLAGQTSTGRTIRLNFQGQNFDRPSDVVGITGTGTDTFVLQLSYDPAIIGKPVVPTFELLRLGYWDPDRQIWVDAGNHNTGQSYADYLQQAGTPVLGDYGVDPATNTLWVVTNQSGLYVAMPEPASLAVAGLGAAALLRRRRR